MMLYNLYYKGKTERRIPSYKQLAREVVLRTFGNERLTSEYYEGIVKGNHPLRKNLSTLKCTLFLIPKLVELLLTGMYAFADRLTRTGEKKPKGDDIVMHLGYSFSEILVMITLGIPREIVRRITSPINTIFKPLKHFFQRPFKEIKKDLPLLLLIVLALAGAVVATPVIVLTIQPLLLPALLIPIAVGSYALVSLFACCADLDKSLHFQNKLIKRLGEDPHVPGYVSYEFFNTHIDADTFSPDQITPSIAFKSAIGLEPSNPKLAKSQSAKSKKEPKENQKKQKTPSNVTRIATQI